MISILEILARASNYRFAAIRNQVTKIRVTARSFSKFPLVSVETDKKCPDT